VKTPITGVSDKHKNQIYKLTTVAKLLYFYGIIPLSSAGLEPVTFGERHSTFLLYRLLSPYLLAFQ